MSNTERGCRNGKRGLQKRGQNCLEKVNSSFFYVLGGIPTCQLFPSLSFSCADVVCFPLCITAQRFILCFFYQWTEQSKMRAATNKLPASSDEETNTLVSKNSPSSSVVQVAFAVALWMSLSSGMAFYNKWLLLAMLPAKRFGRLLELAGEPWRRVYSFTNSCFSVKRGVHEHALSAPSISCETCIILRVTSLHRG